MFSVTFLVICSLGPVFTLAKPNKEVEMPGDCKGKNYCFIKHADYPQKIIDKFLKESMAKLWVEHDTNDFETREGSRNNVCKVRTTNEPIYEIIDEAGKVRYVVQSPNMFQQILRVEECVKPGRLMGRTIHFAEFDLKNNVLQCEQKKIDFNFLVLTPDFKGVELAKAKDGIPICCSSIYYKK